MKTHSSSSQEVSRSRGRARSHGWEGGELPAAWLSAQEVVQYSQGAQHLHSHRWECQEGGWITAGLGDGSAVSGKHLVLHSAPAALSSPQGWQDSMSQHQPSQARPRCVMHHPRRQLLLLSLSSSSDGAVHQSALRQRGVACQPRSRTAQHQHKLQPPLLMPQTWTGPRHSSMRLNRAMQEGVHQGCWLVHQHSRSTYQEQGWACLAMGLGGASGHPL
jgi:hypothetical protein